MTQPELEKLANDCAKSIIPANGPCYAEDVDAASFHIKETLEHATGGFRAEIEQLNGYINLYNLSDRLVEGQPEAKRAVEQLRSELAAEQSAHEQIASLCFAAGAESGDGTSVAAVKSLVQLLAATREKLKEVCELGMCEKDHLCLRSNQLYRFVVMPNCKECDRLDKESALPSAHETQQPTTDDAIEIAVKLKADVAAALKLTTQASLEHVKGLQNPPTGSR